MECLKLNMGSIHKQNIFYLLLLDNTFDSNDFFRRTNCKNHGENCDYNCDCSPLFDYSQMPPGSLLSILLLPPIPRQESEGEERPIIESYKIKTFFCLFFFTKIGNFCHPLNIFIGDWTLKKNSKGKWYWYKMVLLLL